MPELRVRVWGVDGRVDLVARYDERTSIGELADHIAQVTDRPDDRVRTLKRVSRGDADFDRDALVVQSDVRSGDEIRLSIDSGVRDSPAGEALATMRIVEGPDAGRAFELRRGEASIGRSSRCDLILNDTMASRRHAMFRVTDIVEVADSGSTNGVLVNGDKIVGVRRLRPGDQVQVGDTVLAVDVLAGEHDVATVAFNEVAFNRPPRVDRPFTPVAVTMPAPPSPELTRREQRAARSRLLDDARAKAEQIGELRGEEVRSRHHESPSNPELSAIVRDLSSRLWERKRGDHDFMALRVGLREQPSSISVVYDPATAGDYRQELDELVAGYDLLPPVPVVVPAQRSTPIGVAGPYAITSAVTRSLLIQAATLHSPAELIICALVREDVESEWDWLKWLPHTAPVSGLTTCLATGSAESQTLVDALRELVQARLAGSTDGPHVLLLVEHESLIERTAMAPLLESAGSDVSLIWLADDARRLPHHCRSTIVAEPGAAHLTFADLDSATEIGAIPIESFDRENAESIARELAPIVDSSTAVRSPLARPGRIDFVDLVGGIEQLDTGATLARWNNPPRSDSLTFPVGHNSAGPAAVVVSAQCPHIMVTAHRRADVAAALDAVHASVAFSYSPTRAQMVKIDTSSDERWSAWPHQVGAASVKTDSELQRVTAWLRAEVQSRRDVLGQPGHELGHLIVCVDDLGRLRAHAPNSATDLIALIAANSDAHVHLVAGQTQGDKLPGPVLAMPHVHIELSKTSAGDATVRFGDSSAQTIQLAALDQPIGAGSQVEVGEFLFGETRWIPTSPVAPRAEAEMDAPPAVTIAARLADIAQAAGLLPESRPLLPPLPSQVNLLDLPRAENDTALVVGLSDLPSKQKRSVATFQPDSHRNLVITGPDGSGKTTSLRTLASAAALTKSRSPVHVYALDYGHGGLAGLDGLDHVGAVMGPDDAVAAEFLRTVRKLIAYRRGLFASAGADDLLAYRQLAADPTMPRTIVLVDGYEELVARLRAHDGTDAAAVVGEIVSTGSDVGVHMVVAGSSERSFPVELAAARLQLSPNTAGRGWIAGVEVQIATLGGDPSTASQRDALNGLAKALRAPA